MTKYKLTGSSLVLSVFFLVGCGTEEPVFVKQTGPKTEVETETMNTSTYSYRCKGEHQAIVVTLTGDRGYLFSPMASQALLRDAGTGAFIGNDVNYLPEQPPGLERGQSARITILGNDFIGCKNDPRAAVWEAAKLRGVSYRAIGQEPPWVLDIDRDDGFLLSTGYESNLFQFPYSQPESDSALRFRQIGDG